MLTIVNDDQGGVFRIGASHYTVTEDTSNVLVTVTRSGGKASGVEVSYSTAAWDSNSRARTTHRSQVFSSSVRAS